MIENNCIVCEKKPRKDGSDVCIECDSYKPKFVAGKDGTGFTFKIPPKRIPLTTEVEEQKISNCVFCKHATTKTLTLCIDTIAADLTATMLVCPACTMQVERFGIIPSSFYIKAQELKK